MLQAVFSPILFAAVSLSDGIANDSKVLHGWNLARCTTLLVSVCLMLSQPFSICVTSGMGTSGRLQNFFIDSQDYLNLPINQRC